MESLIISTAGGHPAFPWNHTKLPHKADTQTRHRITPLPQKTSYPRFSILQYCNGKTKDGKASGNHPSQKAKRRRGTGSKIRSRQTRNERGRGWGTCSKLTLKQRLCFQQQEGPFISVCIAPLREIKAGTGAKTPSRRNSRLWSMTFPVCLLCRNSWR